jgi:hypothetical protein
MNVGVASRLEVTIAGDSSRSSVAEACHGVNIVESSSA